MNKEQRKETKFNKTFDKRDEEEFEQEDDRQGTENKDIDSSHTDRNQR